jgi:hypothetical protein
VALQWASETLNADRNMWLAILQTYGHLFYKVPNNLRNDKTLLLAASRTDTEWLIHTVVPDVEGANGNP